MGILIQKRVGGVQVPQNPQRVNTCSPRRDTRKGDERINIHTVKCFVFAMNSLCRDWMLIESKRPEPEIEEEELPAEAEPPKPSKE